MANKPNHFEFWISNMTVTTHVDNYDMSIYIAMFPQVPCMSILKLGIFLRTNPTWEGGCFGC